MDGLALLLTIVYMSLQAIGWCLVSFSVGWTILHGFEEGKDLSFHVIVGTILVFSAQIVRDYIREREGKPWEKKKSGE